MHSETGLPSLPHCLGGRTIISSSTMRLCFLTALVIAFSIFSNQSYRPAKYLLLTGGKSNPNDGAMCRYLLDNLDELFDRRRGVRQRQSLNEENRTKRRFDLYEPEATCISEERFGDVMRFNAFGDGPKFVCGVDVIARKAKEQKGGCLIYSVGSNNDVRFERAVHDFMPGCEVHTFDPTLEDEGFVGGEYATFHPWGLGTDGGNEGETMHNRKNKGRRKSFETIMRELGHGNRTIDILKIDCQGCEYAAMPPLFQLMAEGRVRVDQLLIELHDRQKLLHGFFAAADNAGLRVFHKERNGWGCDGYRCVEYAFVSKSFLREANGAAICPGKGLQAD